MSILTHIKKVDDEYQVLVFVNGVQNENATYFTDDKEDAIETSKALCRDWKFKDYSKVLSDGSDVSTVNFDTKMVEFIQTNDKGLLVGLTNGQEPQFGKECSATFHKNLIFIG